jgi:hypothetical protein
MSETLVLFIVLFVGLWMSVEGVAILWRNFDTSNGFDDVGSSETDVEG